MTQNSSAIGKWLNGFNAQHSRFTDDSTSLFNVEFPSEEQATFALKKAQSALKEKYAWKSDKIADAIIREGKKLVFSQRAEIALSQHPQDIGACPKIDASTVDASLKTATSPAPSTRSA